MSLLKAASTVSLLTLLARITGLLRELFIARYFGVNEATDAFNVAFRLPNMLRRLFAEGAFTQAFAPLLNRSMMTDDTDQTKKIIDAIATALTSCLVLTCLIGVVAAPLLVWALASGFSEAGFDLASTLTRLMFPYIGLISLVALSASLLNAKGHFATPAVTPVLLNLGMIIGAWGLSSWFKQPIYGLALGVMLGGILQLALQIPMLKHYRVLPTLSLAIKQAWQHPATNGVLRAMLPALLAVSTAQISLLINTQIASHLGVGRVSWLSFADRLMEFPTALLGVALGVVLLPSLSRASKAEDDGKQFNELMDWGLRLVVLLTLPAVVTCSVFALPLVRLLYQYGAFSATDSLQTASALTAYAVGLFALITIKVLAPGFYAEQNIRAPARIAIISLGITQASNLLLVPYLDFIGLALSISIGSSFNALILLILLLRCKRYTPLAGWLPYIIKVLLASCIMAVLLGSAQHWMQPWLASTQPLIRIAAVCAGVSLALLAYFSVLLLMGVRLRHFLRV